MIKIAEVKYEFCNSDGAKKYKLNITPKSRWLTGDLQKLKGSVSSYERDI